MITRFWNTLFDAGEWVCIVDNVTQTHVAPVAWLVAGQRGEEQFFCINPLSQFGRADANVTCFRNILIEIDDMPHTKQVSYIESLGMPHSTCTFSGHKSMHFIISLEEPCKTKKEYAALVKRIYDKIPAADASAKNPSRLSRTPNGIRDDGTLQSLIYADGVRTSRSILEAWLGPEPKTEKQEYIQLPLRSNGKRLLPARVLAFIEYGATEGARNITLFTNACELFRAGYTYDEIYAIAQEVLDLPDGEMRTCIHSAQ